MADNQTPKQRADQLLEYLNHDKAVNEIFGDSFERQYLIYGKSPRTWRQYFKVAIPETPDTQQCKQLAGKVGSLMQEAIFYYAASEAQLDALASGESKEYIGAYSRLIAKYKQANNGKTPAQKLIEIEASQQIIDIKGAVQNAKIVKNFWKRMIEGLTEVRKNIELATWNNSTQVKQEQYGGGGNIPEHQPNRGQHGREVQEVMQDDWDI